MVYKIFLSFEMVYKIFKACRQKSGSYFIFFLESLYGKVMFMFMAFDVSISLFERHILFGPFPHFIFNDFTSLKCKTLPPMLKCHF